MNDCDNVYVAYLGRLATKKDGEAVIHRKSLGYVLRNDIISYDTAGITEKKSQKLKEESPCIFPFNIIEPSVAYTYKATDSKMVSGEIVFLDIDDEELADKIMSHSDVFVQRIPFVLAMWMSLRNKLHLACLCEWHRASGYNAAWRGLSDEIGSVVKDMFSTDFSKVNDTALQYPQQSISLAAGSGFEYKFFNAKHYVCQIEPDTRIDERKKANVNEYLQIDSVAAEKWKSLSIENWCKWCEKEKGFKFKWYNKEVEYDKHIVIRSTAFSGCRDVNEFDYWLNDGSYYCIDGLGAGYREYKIGDKRKRYVNSCAYFYADILRMGFYEALYNVCTCYLMRCLEWLPSYCNEKQVIAGKVANCCANAGLDESKHEYYRYKYKVLVRPYYAPRVVGGRETIMTGREQNSVRLAITRQLAIEKMIQFYEDGMRAAEMAEILGVDVQTVYRYARECGIAFGQGKRGRKGGREEYVHAYTADGKRHCVRASLVDGKIYFRKKKEIPFTHF